MPRGAFYIAAAGTAVAGVVFIVLFRTADAASAAAAQQPVAAVAAFAGFGIISDAFWYRIRDPVCRW